MKVTLATVNVPWQRSRQICYVESLRSEFQNMSFFYNAKYKCRSPARSVRAFRYNIVVWQTDGQPHLTTELA